MEVKISPSSTKWRYDCELLCADASFWHIPRSIFAPKFIRMTLKELLNKVEFDNVAPYIVQHYPDMAKCLSGFKEAFDGMRNTMLANLDGEQVKVELCIEDGKEPCLAAYHSDNTDWETIVGREMVIDSNVSAPLEEIVAVILYDATFWGFTPEDREETFSEWQEGRTPPTDGNPYRLKWWHLTQREYDSKCRKEDIGTRTYTWVGDNPFTEKRMNRSKRKRAYRWEKRIDELERLANRWDLLQQIKLSAPNTDLSLFESLLFKAARCEVGRREDYSADGIGLPYICELITKYDRHFSKEADLTLLWIQSPNAEYDVMNDICKMVSQPLIVHQTWQKRTRLTIIQLFE